MTQHIKYSEIDKGNTCTRYTYKKVSIISNSNLNRWSEQNLADFWKLIILGSTHILPDLKLYIIGFYIKKVLKCKLKTRVLFHGEQKIQKKTVEDYMETKMIKYANQVE